jgi:hypothetical protein
MLLIIRGVIGVVLIGGIRHRGCRLDEGDWNLDGNASRLGIHVVLGHTGT